MGARAFYGQSLSKYRLLTGERLAVAKRVGVQDFSITLIALILAIVVTKINSSLAGEATMVVFALIVFLVAFRFVRKETYMQLRVQEIIAGRTEANHALKDLHNLAKKLKNQRANEG